MYSLHLLFTLSLCSSSTLPLVDELGGKLRQSWNRGLHVAACSGEEQTNIPTPKGGRQDSKGACTVATEA